MYVLYIYEERERETKKERQDDFGKSNIAKQYNTKFIIRNLSVWFKRAKIGYLNGLIICYVTFQIRLSFVLKHF